MLPEITALSRAPPPLTLNSFPDPSGTFWLVSSCCPAALTLHCTPAALLSVLNLPSVFPHPLLTPLVPFPGLFPLPSGSASSLASGPGCQCPKSLVPSAVLRPPFSLHFSPCLVNITTVPIFLNVWRSNKIYQRLHLIYNGKVDRTWASQVAQW